MMWNPIKTFSVGFCLVLLPFFVSFSFASSTTAEVPQTQTVQMSLEQYNRLKTKVAQLELNLTTLEQNSETDKQELTTLKKQLEDCKTAMSKAEQSSKTASDSLEKLETNLQILTEQTESLKHKLEIKNRQNKIAWIVAGTAILCAASK
ncbi:hypothetical protein [Megasphaera elsdenii]|nr:hypothetical protein [Megasphaera elsdenii]